MKVSTSLSELQEVGDSTAGYGDLIKIKSCSIRSRVYRVYINI